MNRRLIHRGLFVGGILLFTVCIGTIGFSLIEHWGIFDAFYMTLTTITTVGYQEVRPLNQIAARQCPFLVIDRGEERVARASGAGMLAMVADTTNDDDLRKAGVLRARGLIAALPSDAENLFIILSAKTLNNNLSVVTRASEEQNEDKLRRAGADTVFAPYTMAGRRLADSLLRPHVVEFLDFTMSVVGPKIMMEQVRVGSGIQAAAGTLGALLSTNNVNVIVLAVRGSDGRMTFNPSADTRIAAGDFLIVLGDKASLNELERALTDD